MDDIKISDIPHIIRDYVIPDRVVACFHGRSGIGKSEAVAQGAEECEAALVDIRVSQYESVDFRGIPDTSAGTTVWNMPATLPFKGNPMFNEDSGKPILIFLDEVSQGDPSVLSVLYQLLQDFRVGEHILMDNVRIVCALNLSDDRGTGTAMPAPLNNRMVHYTATTDIHTFSKHAVDRNVDSRVIGFLNFRDELLHTYDPAQPDVVDFATPRQWVGVSDLLANKRLRPDLIVKSASGRVGSGPAAELFAFIDIMNSLAPIEEIIADPEGVEISSKMDVQWAMATHVSGHMTKSNADALSKFLSRLEPELTTVAWSMAMRRDDSVTESNAYLYDFAPNYAGLYRD